MYDFLMIGLVVAALMEPSPDSGSLQGGAADSPEAAMVRAMDASEVAEIYVIDRGIDFPTRPTPDTVRLSGCKYLVRRLTPDWGDLARSLTEADIHFAPTTQEGEVRIGLALSDSRGTILEIYANDRPWPDGRLTGFSQRRPLEISPSFAPALLGFVARHPDLMNGSRPELCPPATRGAP